MRDLLFKNLTLTGKKRRLLSLSENVVQDGLQAKSRRHVVYFFQEVADTNQAIEKPSLSVVKIHDSQQKVDRLFCKMKGKIFAVHQQKLYLISFVQTLKIELSEEGITQEF